MRNLRLSIQFFDPDKVSAATPQNFSTDITAQTDIE